MGWPLDAYSSVLTKQSLPGGHRQAARLPGPAALPLSPGAGLTHRTVKRRTGGGPEEGQRKGSEGGVGGARVETRLCRPSYVLDESRPRGATHNSGSSGSSSSSRSSGGSSSRFLSVASRQESDQPLCFTSPSLVSDCFVWGRRLL
ncbi:hypothetical protein E2C01_061702 [Portunus trituberculatus]|uniref:Uncharacterized protein n=1 Tax=Portunus trituberculatus TaxID=210409 RepID=A0A5B7HD44_PORTR|nr:hypothetical protein [Portunus trituberculatus]